MREAFEENFTERGDIGAAVAVTIDGEPVVDLWAGHADAAGTRAWERDTIVNVYSTGKGMLSLGLHMLADRGLVDIEAPVASYWPEFAQAGKEGVTVRHVLGHRSGVVGARRLLPKEACYDWETMTTALAEAEPWWEPGTRHGYHVWTYGWIIGEIVRRVSGRRPARSCARRSWTRSASTSSSARPPPSRGASRTSSRPAATRCPSRT